MRKIASLLLTGVFAVTALAGCTKPPTDFWGNPIDENDPQRCAVQTGPAVPPDVLLNPSVHQRPKGVRDGNSWVVIEYEVRMLPGDLSDPIGYDYCAPVDVHVYAQPGDADVQVYGVNSLDVGPFDFHVQTPWIGRFIFLQYDPREERFAGRPPSYKITMEAKYIREKDGMALLNGMLPYALACKLKIDGGILAQDIAIIAQRDQVGCSLTGNTYHTF